MRYDEVIEHIFKLRRFGGMKLGLERVQELAEKMGNPQNSYKIIHVGGSSGKGSTVAMIASILEAAGYKVGKYTSPHLSRFSERITVNGKDIPEEEVVRLFEEIEDLSKDMEEKPTFFEVTTAMALKWFEEQKVDFAVLEVGLGGRLDATNIVSPLVSVITNVTLEHTNVLGNSILEIAEEKGGIIKEGRPLVTATKDEDVFKLFKNICTKKNCKIARVGDDIAFLLKSTNLDHQEFNVSGKDNHENLKTPLLGEHQIRNAAAAIGAIEALSSYGTKITEKAIRDGLERVKWPGRLEIVQKNPMIVLDCAKDPLAMKSLRKAIEDLFKFKRLIMVISISKDKKIKSMLGELLPISDHVIATKHGVQDRALDPQIIMEQVNALGNDGEIVKDVKSAVKKAIEIAGEKDLICITGSIFTVGEARESWFGQNKTKLGRELNEPVSQ